MKIIIDDKIPFIRGLAEQLADEVVYMSGAEIGPDDVRDADALIIRTRTQCNRQLLQGSRVRFVATATIGYDHLDVDYLREAGIQWTNCPGCNAASVAQYVRNALLEAEREGLICLSKATLGIIGYGHVGTAVFEAMRPYVRHIIVNDPPKFGGEWRVESGVGNPQSSILNPQSPKVSSLHSPLSTLHDICDIITLHTPLTTDGPYPTCHLVDEHFLNRLQRRPIVINAARGGVVCEEALLRALNQGRVRQAIIDTWENEPNINRQLLQQVFIGTPHIAGYSADGKANATRMVLEALCAFCGKRLSSRYQEIPTASPSRTGLRYSPLEDAVRLKAAPDQFEQQRGNYPLRRE